ncbi:MAG TPA: ABC transporter ATP-binding protein [Solirubrobacteraceae bacterium]|nr:ABC transporter ATP-binding protein [Solirubrobacteraceae bacterium]
MSAAAEAPVVTPVSTDALTVDHVDVSYTVRRRDQAVLRDVSFRVGRGESFGLVGESGCGKSTMALAIVRYLARNGRVSAGSIAIDGEDVLAMNEGALRRLRATKVSMVYQEPGRALNPSIRVGPQVAEVFQIAGKSDQESLELSEEMLRTVRISDPAVVMRRYPHQLSGGMLQRTVIAMALASEPSLLILDEPTTALDATVEAEVLDLVKALRQELGTSLLFISHNLGVIARMCDRVGVLYAGELVEEGPALEVLHDARHPYTVGLLRCIPRRDADKRRHALDTIPGFLPRPGDTPAGCIFADRCGLVEERCRTEAPPLYEIGPARRSRCHFHGRAQTLPRAEPAQTEAAKPRPGDGKPLISARDVGKTFRLSGQEIHGLTGVSLDILAGETLGLVGESGSGKTTLARVLMGLTAPDAGSSVELDGRALAYLTKQRTAEDQKSLQIVFQNPDSALNRRHSVRRLIGRSLSKLGHYTGAALQTRLLALVQSVRLTDRYLPMRPSQLSGGLKQRVAIARAFAGDPRVVVCDEPTSALDVSVQAAILNLLNDLQTREDVAYLFISHDLGVVRYLSDRIAVLYLGRLMELGPANKVFSFPHHPYTEALLSAVPTVDDVDSERIRLDGEIPSAANPPSGCVFHTRCPRKIGEICETTEPELLEAEPGHAIRCHIPIEELRRIQVSPPPAKSLPTAHAD